MTYIIKINEELSVIVSGVADIQVYTDGLVDHVRFIGHYDDVLALYRLSAIEGFHKEGE
jgi:hypothetical protein